MVSFHLWQNQVINPEAFLSLSTQLVLTRSSSPGSQYAGVIDGLILLLSMGCFSDTQSSVTRMRFSLQLNDWVGVSVCGSLSHVFVPLLFPSGLFAILVCAKSLLQGDFFACHPSKLQPCSPFLMGL